MKIKKGYNLFFMLAILIAHTLVLSFWLADGQLNPKQANFKVEEEKTDFNVLNAKFVKHRDSVKTIQPVFTINLGSSLK